MDSVSELLSKADQNFNKKLYHEAEAQYTSLIEEFKDFESDGNFEIRRCLAKAYNNRGQIKYLRVDFSEAIEDYTEALHHDARMEAVLYNRGLIHYRLGRYTAAIQDFTGSLKINPKFQDSIQGLKVAHLEQSKKGDRCG